MYLSVVNGVMQLSTYTYSDNAAEDIKYSIHEVFQFDTIYTILFIRQLQGDILTTKVVNSLMSITFQTTNFWTSMID